MRYALHLLPSGLLLIALLRMTFVGLAIERRAVFGFLLAWLTYSLLLLFCAQIWPADSPEYLRAFVIASASVWPLAGPALHQAAGRLAQSAWHSAAALAVVALSIAGARYAMVNSSFAGAAKALAVNCFVAAIVGAVFALAAGRAEGPDRVLWGCAGAFFLTYGYGYLLTGILRPRSWAYLAFVFAGSAAWFALAWFIGPHPDVLFNLEKLGIIWPAWRPASAFVQRLRRAL